MVEDLARRFGIGLTRLQFAPPTSLQQNDIHHLDKHLTVANTLFNSDEQ